MKKDLIFWAFSLYFLCTLTSMAFMSVSFFVLVLFFIWTSTTEKKWATVWAEFQDPSLRNYKLGTIFLLFACYLSLLIAKIDPLAYSGHVPEITLHGFVKIWYLFCPGLIFLAFMAMKGTGESLTRLLKVWFFALPVLLMVAVIQFNVGWPHKQVIPTNPDHFHATLFFGHHLSTASIIIFPTFVALSLFFGRVKRAQSFSRLEFIAAFSGLAILFLSYARTAWIAMILGLILLFVRYLKIKTVLKSLAGLFLLLGIASQTSFMKQRIETLYGVSERMELWKANIEYFTKRPLTGIGWLKTQEMSEFYFKDKFNVNYQSHFWGHAHSNFFEMLGGTGLLGLLAFLFWTYFTLSLGFQTSRIARIQNEPFLEDLSWGLLTALLLLHFNGLTNVTFWEGKVMHSQMLAVGLLLICQVLLKKRSSLR